MLERFIARQPIFDQRLKVMAYELLFRASARNVFEPRENASSRVFVDANMLFDLQTLTGAAKAFLNADETALLRGAPRLLPKDRIVIEVLETVAPTREIVEACKQLHEEGYVLALDDFLDQPKWQPLVDLAAFLKVDFRICDCDTRRIIAQRYRRKRVHLLAEKVETQEDLASAKSLGYTFFQGFFFARPVVLEAREMPTNKLVYLRLLDAIAPAELSIDKVESILKQEPSLVYKLLRYLNSPLLALRAEIHKIRDAIQLLGECEFRRWVSIVAIVSMSSDKPNELIRTALTRAYFCEEISKHIGMTSKGSDLFLMGLLSVTDAMLDRPLHEILAYLPVSGEVRLALCGGSNDFHDAYTLMTSYERADWPALSAAAVRLHCPEDQIPSCYLAAVDRANHVVS
jgi:EAL and modified HD-GYP domain-containing signal transduction protein